MYTQFLHLMPHKKFVETFIALEDNTKLMHFYMLVTTFLGAGVGFSESISP
jgi:hypothetical protein